MGAIRCKAQFQGGLKANARVIDGVADNGVDNENWVFIQSASTDGFNITIVNGTIERAKLYNMNLEVSTEYVLVYNVTNEVGVDFSILGTESDIDANINNLPILVGENRKVFTTSSTITFNGLSHYLRSGEVTFNTYRVYKVSDMPNFGEVGFDPLTDPLPTSQDTVLGNSQIELTTKYDVVEADKLTTLQHFEYDVDGEATPIPIAYADMVNSDNNVRLIKFDEDGKALEQLLYSEQTEDQTTLNAMMTYIATEGYTLTESSDGWILIDADGNIIYSEV